MRNFEYKAIPAPNQGKKARGVKATEDRFALSLTDALNEMAADGWEYLRAETLPCNERKGLTGTQITYQNILIFRKLEAKTEMLTLDPSPRIVSENSTNLSDAEPEKPMLSARAASEPVTPRRISTGVGEHGSAPPLGSARED